MKRKVHILLTVLILTLVMGFTVYADEFTISQTKATINIGDTIDLDISDADKAPRWTSYNVNIARVNQDGEVTAVRKGKTTISARIGLTYKKCSVTVVDTSIKLNKKAATIYTGGTSTNTVQLKATTKGASKSVLWNSDNTAVATVDATGKVTSVSAGTATITATANGKTESCKITVLDSSIVLNMSDLQLSTKGNGSSIKIAPTIIGSKKSVKWTSSDTTVATVSGGTVKGKKNGTAVITATANGVSATCNVTVVEGLISINSEKELLYTGESKQLKTNAAKTDIVTWNSSDTSVATVSDGKITAVGAGTSVISVECNGKTDTCEVTVKDTATIIGEDAVELKTKGTNKIYTLGYEVIGRKPNVKWTTSNASVATASNGKITAKKAGTATITATANGVSDSVQVTVKDFDPTIKLNQNEYTLYTGKGNTLTLKATVDGASKSVSWSSSDSSVATVDRGKVKALKEGQTLITATANGVTADCIITVKESKVILETENIHLDKGETAKLPVDIIGVSQSVKYATTNSKAVTVKNGVITAKNYGEADIKVTANGVTSICHVNVSECTHSFDAGTITKEPTCTEEGTKVFKCTICGYEYTETMDKTEHTWEETAREEATCLNKGTITYTCSVCANTKQETTEPLGHSYGEWSVVTEPTETAEGLEKQSCIRCGTENTRIIPTKAHEHHYRDVVTEPTCTEEGYTMHICTCGDTYKDTIVAALGHDWGEWITTKEPTEIETGKKKHICSRCKEEEAEDIPVVIHEHKYTTTVTEPTCTEKGYTTHTCSECGHCYVDTYTDAAGHKYTDVVTEGTCKERGYTTHTCSKCGDSYVDTYTNALGHDYQIKEVVEPTNCGEGYTVYECSRCGLTERRDKVPMAGDGEHEYDYYNVELWDDNYYEVDCKYCDYFCLLTMDKILKYREVDTKIKEIIGNIITNDMCDAEKIIEVNNWICLNCYYDYGTYNGTNKDNDSYDAYGAIVKGKAVCAGYAKAFKEFMNELGIECRYVRSDSLNHAWNQVKLDDDWYWLDCTWNDYDIEDFYYNSYFLRTGQRTEDEEGGTICNGTKWVDWLSLYEKYRVSNSSEINQVYEMQKDNYGIYFLFDSEEDYKEIWSISSEYYDKYSESLSTFVYNKEKYLIVIKNTEQLKLLFEERISDDTCEQEYPSVETEILMEQKDEIPESEEDADSEEEPSVEENTDTQEESSEETTSTEDKIETEDNTDEEALDQTSTEEESTEEKSSVEGADIADDLIIEP